MVCGKAEGHICGHLSALCGTPTVCQVLETQQYTEQPQISAPSFQTRFSNNFQTRQINQTWLCQRRQRGSKGTAGFTDPSELSESSHAVPSIPHLAFLAVFSVPPSPTVTWSHQWPPLCSASTRACTVPSMRVLMCAARLCSLAGAPCGWTSNRGFYFPLLRHHSQLLLDLQ